MGGYEDMSGDHSMVGYLVDVEATRRKWRIFKNPTGRAWVGIVGEDGKLTFRNRETYFVELYDARSVSYGLCVGSSDRVGWRTLEISPDMVGRRIAQLVAIECKTSTYGKCSEEQKNFLSQVARAGGLALIARRRGAEVELEEVKP
jgi:hypothetical protein